MVKLRAVLVLCAALGACEPALAADAAASEASIHELLDTLHSRTLVDGIVQRAEQDAREQAHAIARTQPLNAEQLQILDEMQDKMRALTEQTISWNNLEPMMVRVYRETLTQDDVDGMLKFYRSPAGQAMINKLPLITSRIMDEMRNRMQQLTPQLAQLQQDSLARLRAAATPPAKSP